MTTTLAFERTRLLEEVRSLVYRRVWTEKNFFIRESLNRRIKHYYGVPRVTDLSLAQLQELKVWLEQPTERFRI